MEATELRIGNYVNKSLKSGQGRTLIDRIGCQDIVRIVEGIGSFNYSPVELTEELLLKCGFIRSDESSVGSDYERVKTYKLKGFTIAINESGEIGILNECEDAYYNFMQIEIKYVHQLQNLFFCLCEEELEFSIN